MAAIAIAQERDTQERDDSHQYGSSKPRTSRKKTSEFGSKRSPDMQTSQPSEKQPVSNLNEEREMDKVAEDSLCYFCGLVFNAVCGMVARSHTQLCGALCSSCSVGRGGLWQGSGVGSGSRLSGTEVTKSYVNLGKLKTVRFQNTTEALVLDNPRDVVTNPNLRSRFSIPHLRLKVRIQFSIPRIHMEPLLSDIYKDVSELTSDLLSVLHKLVWWAGPSRGRSFYSMWDASGAVEYMYEEILQTFKCKIYV